MTSHMRLIRSQQEHPGQATTTRGLAPSGGSICRSTYGERRLPPGRSAKEFSAIAFDARVQERSAGTEPLRTFFASGAFSQREKARPDQG